jgi:hypothetical protein
MSKRNPSGSNRSGVISTRVAWLFTSVGKPGCWRMAEESLSIRLDNGLLALLEFRALGRYHSRGALVDDRET